MKYNPQHHHRRSIRLKGYDYSQAAAYFITICCAGRECIFGEIRDGEMILNNAGEIAIEEWMKTPELRLNVELDAFVVMPNHIHGIIVINDIGRVVSHTPINDDTPPIPTVVNETHKKGEFNSFPKKGEFNSPLRSPSQTVGSIVRGYKSSVTKKMTELNRFNDLIVWQRNYYEHIIRNEQSYQTISDYIVNNPLKWTEDKFFVA